MKGRILGFMIGFCLGIVFLLALQAYSISKPMNLPDIHEVRFLLVPDVALEPLVVFYRMREVQEDQLLFCYTCRTSTGIEINNNFIHRNNTLQYNIFDNVWASSDDLRTPDKRPQIRIELLPTP